MANEVTREIPDSLDGERVDKAVAELLGVSRSVARDLVTGGATVDGATLKPADKVTAGSILTSPTPQESVSLLAEPVDFDVLFEDEHLLVVDKPAGVVVHPGAGRQRGTLAAGLLYRYPGLEGVGQKDRWGLVHRLDKDTSGTLIVAKTSSSYQSLTGLLRERGINRTYLALVVGLFDAPTGTVEAPIGRDPQRPERRVSTHDGKPATTHYEVVESFPPRNCSLLEVTLETGRTHQIRVHMAAIDHPVAGDRNYGRPTSEPVVPRIFLHAARVDLVHPVTGEPISVSSPLPEDLASALSAIRGGSVD